MLRGTCRWQVTATRAGSLDNSSIRTSVSLSVARRQWPAWLLLLLLLRQHRGMCVAAVAAVSWPPSTSALAAFRLQSLTWPLVPYLLYGIPVANPVGWMLLVLVSLDPSSQASEGLEFATVAPPPAAFLAVPVTP